MDSGTWIGIATVLATLISPLIPIWYGNRLKHTRTTQGADQPKVGRIKSWLSKPRASYLISTLSILALLLSLILVLFERGPVTRLTIVLISFYIAVILIHILIMLIARMESKIYESINDIRATQRSILSVQSGQLDLTKDISDTHLDLFRDVSNMIKTIDARQGTREADTNRDAS